MPIYEYLCDACGHQLETIRKISDPPLTLCPECEKDTLRKQVSAPSFRLSGTGWYETDFKSDNEKRRNLAGSDSAGPSGKTGESKSDTKSDATATKADKPKTNKAASTAKAS